MTISSQIRTAGPFVGNGSATGGPFSFKIFVATEMIGTETDLSGANRTLVYGTDFNVILNPDQNASPGGTINYLIAGIGPSLIPTGFALNFTSNVQNLQPVALTNNGGFFPNVINDALDRLTILVQQVLRLVSSSLKFPLSDGAINSELPPKALRANQAFLFDSNGDILMGALASAPVSAAMQPVVAASTLVLARVALGLGSNFTTEATITAAATTNLGSLASQEIVITGNTGITSFGNSATLAAPLYFIRFTGTPLLTNSGTMIIAGGANFTAAAGDMAIAKFEGSSTWRIFPFKANGQPIVGLSGPLTGITSINGGQIGGLRNFVKNGAMNLAQRSVGTAIALVLNTPTYNSLDRWAFNHGAVTAGISQQISASGAGLTAFNKCCKLGRNNGNAGTGLITMNYAAETVDSLPLAGQQVTLSFYAKAGANFSAAAGALGFQVGTGTGVDQSIVTYSAWPGQAIPITSTATLTTSWQRFQATGTLSAAMNQYGLAFSYGPVGTAGADDNVYITGIQLEIGTVATPFEYLPLAVEQEIMERYFEKSFQAATVPAQNVGAATGESVGMAGKAGAAAEFIYVPFKTRKRASPTVSTFNPAATNGQIRDESAGADCSAGALSMLQETGTNITCTGNAGTAVGNLLGIHWSADAEL